MKKNRGLREWVKSAQIIEKPTHGWVHCPDAERRGIEDIFELVNIDEHCDETEKPCFVFDCDQERWDGIDVYDTIQYSLCNFCYDAESQITDYEELKNFLESWNKKQNVVQYVANYTRIIVLDSVRFEKFLNGEEQ